LKSVDILLTTIAFLEYFPWFSADLLVDPEGAYRNESMSFRILAVFRSAEVLHRLSLHSNKKRQFEKERGKHFD